MKRRKLWVWKHLVSRKKGSLVKILFLTMVVALAGGWLLADATSKALLPPQLHQDVQHFRRSSSLKHYLDAIQNLIEPSTTACDKEPHLPILVVVASSPHRFHYRQAIRSSWAKHVPTYFFMGLNGPTIGDLLTDNYIEAKMYSDLVVYDFTDHYQNLTLKTVLMMTWALDRCPKTKFVFKTDDDVFINPWTMKKVLKENQDADLIGYRRERMYLHRDQHSKWYSPRWLHYDDLIPEYLCGAGYLVKGKHVRSIVDAALRVPLVNLEDVYLTYLVAKEALGLALTHEPRLRPYKPWAPLPCMFWGLASAHGLDPDDMLNIWAGIRALGKEYENNDKQLCDFHAKYLSRCRRKKIFLIIILLWTFVFWLHYVLTRVSNEPSLEHFRSNRNLTHYLNQISLLKEPSVTPCDGLYEVPLLVVVPTTSGGHARRDAIRAASATHFPTYFLLGVSSQDDAANVFLEAEQYNDLIIYDFQDHYQNLTLKTALMLRWTRGRCPTAGFLLKADDDVLVNPWIMSRVLKENHGAQLIGSKEYDVALHRNEHDKWYLPRWLFSPDSVPEYLLGPAYLINGKHIKDILDAAAEVAMINLEDIYFTYLVARTKLGLKLTHDDRFQHYIHWFQIPCMYWPFAITHGVSAGEINEVWPALAHIAKINKNNSQVCSVYTPVLRLFGYFCN